MSSLSLSAPAINALFKGCWVHADLFPIQLKDGALCARGLNYIPSVSGAAITLSASGLLARGLGFLGKLAASGASLAGVSVPSYVTVGFSSIQIHLDKFPLDTVGVRIPGRSTLADLAAIHDIRVIPTSGAANTHEIHFSFSVR